MLSRRGLLRSSVLALGVEPRGVLDPRPARTQDSVAGLARPAHAATPPSKLSEAELQDLVAFAELLVVGRALLPTERDALAASIEEHVARVPDHLELCRTTVTLLQALAGRPFSSLDVTERVGLITRHRLNSPDAGSGENVGPLAAATRLVRTRARRELIADYYRSPAGWAAVGYDVFPGRCGDLARYTRPES
jgi:hypothetical protein